MKFCKKCNIEKDDELFYKDKGKKDGRRGSCIECDKIYTEKNKEKRKEYIKDYSEKNKEKRKEYFEKYKEKNKDSLLEKRKLSYEKNKEEILLKQKEYNDNNKENINERSRARYHNLKDKKTFNKRKNDKKKEYRKEYYEENKENILLRQKEYYEENKENIKKYREGYKPIRNKKRREEYKYKIQNDKIFYLSESIRSLIKASFKKSKFEKNSKTNEILGCSFEEFKVYLESKFESWMNWDNKGLYNGEQNYGWDIDHIIPLASAQTEDDIIRLNHYTNLQPLCSYINRVIKRDKI
jgi:hypothetical protein